jgi:hypothetical protein
MRALAKSAPFFTGVGSILDAMVLWYGLFLQNSVLKLRFASYIDKCLQKNISRYYYIMSRNGFGMINAFLYAIVIWLSTFVLGQAATIDLLTFGYARSQVGFPLSTVEFPSFDSVSDGPTQASFTVVSSGTSAGVAQVSVNSDSGQIKTKATTSFGSFPAEAGAAAQGALSEQISVTGSGTVTVLMAYDGFWNLLPYYDFDPESYQFNIQGSITLSSSRGLLAGDVAFVEHSSGASGNTSGILEATIDVFDGDTLGLYSSWLSQIVIGLGEVNFFNTASLSLFASSGVSLSYADPDFLSKTPDVPSTIPLAPSAFLLFGALVTLRVSKSRVKLRPKLF